jgi:hypothetical protein
LKTYHTEFGLKPRPCSNPALDISFSSDAHVGSSSPNIPDKDNHITQVSTSAPVCQREHVLPDVIEQSDQLQAALIEANVSPHIENHLTGSTANDATTHGLQLRTRAQQPPTPQCYSYLSRILRTYPRMMSRREQLPPFIHETQTSSENITAPLAYCFALARMWESSGKGVIGKDIIESSIRQEMDNQFNKVSHGSRHLAEGGWNENNFLIFHLSTAATTLLLLWPPSNLY